MKKILLLLSLAHVNPAVALTVIQVDGPVTAIQPYLTRIQHQSPYLIEENAMLTKLTPKVFAPSLPVTPAPLTVGQVKRQLVHYPQLPQPIFLIGKDTESLAWLQEHKARLQTLKAIGFLIEANTPEEWKAIQASAAELPIIPANGSIFVKRFKVEHYPVLISQAMVEQ